MFRTFAFTAALLMLAGSAGAVELPPICGTGAAMDHGGMDMGAAPAPADEAHQALMAGMDAMSAQMDQAMLAEDIDVAFICGMIPHHQGAIDMAKAELQYGDDPWAKDLAQKIISAQEAEIAQMLEWLAKQPQP
ncbi:MAG: DUF305 domain-containing protein [Devosia sp.]